MTLRVAAAGLAMVLAASACDSSGSPPAPSQPTSPTAAAPAGPAPCSLVTAAEAEAFLGRPIGARTSEADRCTWPAADGNGFVAVTVNRPDQPRATLEAGRISDGGEPVGGIGQGAYIALPTPELGIVAFFTGPLAVSILTRSPTRDRTALLNLAGTAASRI